MNVPVEVVTDLNSPGYDGILLVTNTLDSLTGPLAVMREPILSAQKVDGAVGKAPSVVALPASKNSPSAGRVVYAPTGPVDRDYDDVRRFSDAAVAGIKRALSAGVKAPLLVAVAMGTFKFSAPVACLGALHALYTPIEVREALPDKAKKVEKLGIFYSAKDAGEKQLSLLKAVENGRAAARDIGGSDPERMAAPNVASYVQELFNGTSVSVNIIASRAELKKSFPLLAAVDRASSHIDRHTCRLIELEYTGEGAIDQTLLLVGKGVTYDTGGADIKAGGVMAGMHRDKCGAAAIAGFFKSVADLKPRGIKVYGLMAMVRNSVGNDSYVADEIITSRAGVRVRVGNTDAEGRMAMSDPLCRMKERALESVNPQILTIATLTGHVKRAFGRGYSAILDNGPAAAKSHARQVQDAGDEVGDMFEVSTLRREDYDFVDAPSEYEDVLQCNNVPSTMTPRGHQFPAAFMIRASGLDKHGINSEKPIPYSHIDIAGSAGPFPGVPTGAPVTALVHFYLKGRF